MKRPVIVAAKLARPRVEDVFPRPRLLDALRRGVEENPVTLVRAGAGYGKTTLLATLAESGERPVVWYSLGPGDRDLPVFLWHLATAFQHHGARYARSLRVLLKEAESGRAVAGSAAGAFLNDLGRVKQPLLVVLDDFHRVEESSALVGFLAEVVEGAAGPVRFVIASRTAPPLPLGRLRVRRRLFELTPDDLAFTRDELQGLLARTTDRPPGDRLLELLRDRTEGWVAAIQLLLAASRDRGPDALAAALRRATDTGSAIHDYLVEEVLSQAAAEDRDWMVRTAILESVEPDVVERILPGDVDSRLRKLVERSLLQPYESGEQTTYRYHALFRDVLLRRFRAEVEPGERRELHLAAAEVYRARGDLVAATRQVAQLGDPATLAGYLRRHAPRMLEEGHYQALLAWFEELSPEVFEANPELRLRLGDVRHFLGDWPGAELEYQRARSRSVEAGDFPGEAWATLGLLRIWNLRGESERVVEVGGPVLEALSAAGTAEERRLRTRLLQVVSGAHFYLGRYGEALALLDELEPLVRRNPDRQAALWNNRGVVYASQGSFAEAARAFERGLDRPGVRRSPRASLHLCNLALLRNEMDDTEGAGLLLREALHLAESFGNRGQVLSCLIGLAHLHHRLREVDRSLELLREVEALNQDLKIPLVEADAHALRARILADQGNYGASRAALHRALSAYGPVGRDANWLNYRIEAARVDLRAGRVREAYQALEELRPLSDELEALYPRVTLRFLLGEAGRRLGESGSPDLLGEAVARGIELGYRAFLRECVEHDPEPFLALLARERLGTQVAELLRSAGVDLEPRLLERLAGATRSEERVAFLDLLGEVGGRAAHGVLSAREEDAAAVEEARTRALERLGHRHPELDARVEVSDSFSLQTLGGIRLAGPSGRIPRTAWKSRRSLSLFVYLALQDRGVSRDRLIELFWPGRPVKSAERNFNPTVSYVRRALRDHTSSPVIRVRDGVYSLDPEFPLEVDAIRFERSLARMRRADPGDARLEAAEEALAIYAGDFLGDAYEPWAEEIRAGLSSGYEEALDAAAALLLERGNLDRARELLLRGLERNAYREESHVRLMSCYHALGDRRAVKEQYRTLQKVLREELDVDPLPETTALYETYMIATP